MPLRLSPATWLILLYKSKIWLQQHISSTHEFVLICEVMGGVGKKNVWQWSCSSNPVQTLLFPIFTTLQAYIIYIPTYITLSYELFIIASSSHLSACGTAWCCNLKRTYSRPVLQNLEQLLQLYHQLPVCLHQVIPEIILAGIYWLSTDLQQKK